MRPAASGPRVLRLARRMRARAWIPTGVDDAPLQLIDLVDGRSSINQRHLRRRGLAGWQNATTAGLLTTWELTPKPGLFLDVGANAGVYSLLCRLLWPSIQAIAFEPSPKTLGAGLRWAEANDVEVVFEQAAVSDADGRAPLYLSSKSDASHSLVAGFRKSSQTLDVDLITLDTYVQREGIVPTVLKIDVEQHELSVLRGAREILAQYQPAIVMEVLKTAASKEAQSLLTDLGYRSHRLGPRDRLYWPGQIPARWDETFRGWLRAVDRCVPAGRG